MNRCLYNKGHPTQPGGSILQVETPNAVGHIPSGLFIVCTVEGEAKDGFLASWIQQVSFSPLLVGLAIKPGRRPYDVITAGKIFTINIVGEHQTQYLRHFWSSYDVSPFGEIPHRVSESGGLLMEDAKSVLECKMHSQFCPGDHQLVCAEVLASYIFDAEARPKIHLRKSGLSY